jgi:type IV pilus modification protein PilV
MKPIRQTEGFTLVEVLVAVVILSVGLLGLAGMQITGLRSVNNASSYTQATLAVNDIIERIRTNPVAVENNAFLDIDSATNIHCGTLPNPYCSEYHDGSNIVAAQSCTAAEMASFDINIWFCGENIGGGNRTGALPGIFPQARATITCNDQDPFTDPADPAGGTTPDGDPCTFGSPHTISLSWNELNPERSPNAPESVARNISMTFKP